MPPRAGPRQSFRRNLHKQRRVILNAVKRHLGVLSLKVDQRAITAEAIGDEACRAGSGERIEDVGGKEAPMNVWI